MLDFFAEVLGYIHMAADYFVNFITSLGTFIVVVGDSIGLPFLVAGYMPTILGSAIFAVIGIGLLKFIVGR